MARVEGQSAPPASALLTALTRRWVASSVSIWGKVPTHADYVKHAVYSQEAVQWQQWLAQHAPFLLQSPEAGERAGAPRSGARRGSRAEPGWIQLDAPAKVELGLIPVAFILPPGTLAFSGQRHVTGILLPSHDKAGRAHPLVIYQTVHRAWLASCMGMPELQWWLALAQLLERWYWLQEVEDDAVADAAVLVRSNWLSLCQQVEDLASRLRPTWGHLWSRKQASTKPFPALFPALVPGRSSQQSLSDWLALGLPFAADAGADLADWALSSHRAQGVRHMPWTDWPERVWRHGPSAAFWQQDSGGGILRAANKLADILSAHRSKP